MITADKLRLLTNMPPIMLTEGIRQSGYKKDKFETSEFLGMSNSNQFVYKVSIIENDSFIECKVFVNYDPITQKVNVDY